MVDCGRCDGELKGAAATPWHLDGVGGDEGTGLVCWQHGSWQSGLELVAAGVAN